MHSAASSARWIWSSKTSAVSHLTTYTVSSTCSFSIYKARRRDRVARCSLNGDSFSRQKTSVGPAEVSFPIDDELESSTVDKKELVRFVFVEDERFTPLSRRPRFRLRSKSSSKRRLWSRIFYASKKVRSIILLNVLTVIYASDIPVLKEVEAVMEPSFFNMVRFSVTVIPFLPFMLRDWRDGHIRSAGTELGFWVSCGYLSQALGLLTSEAGHASFISAFTVVIVPFVDGMLGARIPLFIWFGAIVSLIGVALLECGGTPPCVGDILNLLSAIFFGIHMLRTEHITRSTRKDKIMALLGYEVCTVALSTVIWFMLKNIFGSVHQENLESWTWSNMWDQMSSFPWIPTLYTGVFSTGLCLWAEMNAMNDISATETAVVYGLEPVWGAAFAWFLLGERWGSTEWIGASLVLCGSLAVQILSSISESSNDETSDDQIHLNAPGKQNDLSFSAVAVNQKKNLNNLVRKQDKL